VYDDGMVTDTYLPPRLVSSPSFMLTRLGGEARRRLTEALAAEGLKLGDYAAIALLAQLDSAPQQTLSRILNIDRSNVVEIVDRLEACGAAERQPDPDDRRRYAVRLTARGGATLERCAAAAQQVDDALLEPLDADGRHTLLRLLARVAAHHDEHVSLARGVQVEPSSIDRAARER
jgi:MarR family transcriptional regulator, lower aerobic nicotinate degradation pathway regulator